ncbi:MAG TPA: GNAT family N-acetyltransferase [Solirubrobacter sp.]|nr:GNAT family N-acetyltransferase [Solirubrobacter sp.]
MRPIEVGEWPGAIGVIHRALFDQPFARQTYGDGAVTRWGRSYDDYAGVRREHYSLALGAFAGPVVVGVVLASLPDACQACKGPSPTARLDDPIDALNWQFDRDRAAVHRAQPAHAWISKLTVEPALQGLGIGRALLDAVTAQLPTSLPVLLECEMHRERFYAARGFRRVTTVPDPTGPDVLLLRLAAVNPERESVRRPGPRPSSRALDSP